LDSSSPKEIRVNPGHVAEDAQTAAQLEVSSTPPDADIEIDGSFVATVHRL
jgi:hypothetical protein